MFFVTRQLFPVCRVFCNLKGGFVLNKSDVLNKSYIDFQAEITTKLLIDYSKGKITQDEFIAASRGLSLVLNNVCVKELQNI